MFRLVILALCFAAPTLAEPYRLHSQDRLLIRVLVWDFSQGNMTGWQSLSGEYSIGDDGNLQLPLAGVIAAEGQTVLDLRESISDRLRLSAGLERQPELSVELVGGLPVYVLGAVETRGAVDFRPGMTARQAMALAGGPQRVAADPLRMIALAGELRAADADLARLQADLRLVESDLALLDGAQAQAPGDALHVRLQDADHQARRARIASLDGMESLLRDKIQRMDRQMVLRGQQLTDYGRELAAAESLQDRGLAANARVTALATTVNDLESRRLDLETMLLTAQQQLNETARDRTAITDDARSAALARMADLRGQIELARIRLDNARAAHDAAAGVGDLMRPEFTITRDGQTGPSGADAMLEPGDTLEIRLVAP